MAKVTITLEDVDDLDTGRFSVDMQVEDGKQDDGFITAAHLTAVFITRSINTPGFKAGLQMFAEQMILGRDGQINQPQEADGGTQVVEQVPCGEQDGGSVFVAPTQAAA